MDSGKLVSTNIAGMDEINNLRLIENGLLHVQFELEQEEPSYFRVAREAHMVLYRAMIETLRGSANLAVTGRLSKNPSFKYQRGTAQWQEIHRSDTNIAGCKNAWRFSDPVGCASPQPPKVKSEQPSSDDYLIKFYSAVAMIQTECFMGRFVHSRRSVIVDNDMKILEWLHEDVRNEYEHFVPKFYIAPVHDLLMAAETCFRVCDDLLFHSNNVLFDAMQQKHLQDLIQSIFRNILRTQDGG
jgi:hypothetical protein